MMNPMKLRHKFVENIPDELEESTIYISAKYATTMHKCCCGCGNLVVAPLSPNDWSLTFDGETISLDPSIGNWSFPCQSHYWICRSKVIWLDQFTSLEVAEVRDKEKRSLERYYKQRGSKYERHRS